MVKTIYIWATMNYFHSNMTIIIIFTKQGRLGLCICMAVLSIDCASKKVGSSNLPKDWDERITLTRSIFLNMQVIISSTCFLTLNIQNQTTCLEELNAVSPLPRLINLSCGCEVIIFMEVKAGRLRQVILE